ncbi:4-hydroxythreonine-4-phosphate dehydrogenase PdxA [Novispirillum sp. DQ9]|uniref:4-hydroxythreonine-4-phosphate dehydrogenase PdxA n=1 Tax=Novispirillum sp. DQ9 TaxID=3398612 RepID=UPI003C7C02E3
MVGRPLLLTMGDPAGIGGDVALAAWAARDTAPVPPFALIDDAARLRALAARLGLDVPVREIAAPAEATAVFPAALPVLPLATPLGAPVTPGQPDAANAAATVDAIAQAVALVQAGAAAVVTNPINKQVLHAAGFPHPGHTEYLAALAGEDVVPVMMLACAELRVVPVTIHVSLREAAATLSAEAIVTCGRITAAALRERWGIAAPRLAVAGLNPHAGEGGDMGREEIDIIAPAIARLRAEGIAVEGPAPADTLFHPEARARYDAALCMYHDQALIPIKTIDFHGGVNVTLGLPFVRTSPDHGTAYGLAGTGKANASSLRAALRMAAAMTASLPSDAP